MAAALCRKRPSPLASGQPRTWACGIVYALGQLNFLPDKASQPHMAMAEVCAAFGVGQSTAGAKARVIADALRSHRMDAAWMLRSFVDYNPRRLVSAGTGQCKGLIDQPRTNGRWCDPCQAQQRRSVADRACGFRRSLDQLWPCGVRLSSLTQRPEQQREGGCRP